MFWAPKSSVFLRKVLHTNTLQNTSEDHTKCAPKSPIRSRGPQIKSIYFGGESNPFIYFRPFTNAPSLGPPPPPRNQPYRFPPPNRTCRFAMQTASLHGSFRSRSCLRRLGFQASETTSGTVRPRPEVQDT